MWHWHETAYVDPVLFVVVVLGLLVTGGTARGRVREGEVSSWQAAREVRPIPRVAAPTPRGADHPRGARRGDRRRAARRPGGAARQQAEPRRRDRHLRDHRVLPRGAHRMGRTGEPRAGGVRGHRRGRVGRSHGPARLGPVVRVGARRGGRCAARRADRPPGAAPPRADARGDVARVRAHDLGLAAEPQLLRVRQHDRLAATAADRPTAPVRRDRRRHRHPLLLPVPRRARARGRDGLRGAAQPNRPRDRRRPGERTGRGVLRSQQPTAHAVRARVLGIPRGVRRRPLRVPAVRTGPRAVSAAGQPRGLRDGRHRRSGIDSRRADRRDLPVRRAVLPAAGMADPRDRRRAPRRAARPARRPRWRPGRRPRLRAAARRPTARPRRRLARRRVEQPHPR